MEDGDLTAPAAVNDAACLSAHVSVCVCVCVSVFLINSDSSFRMVMSNVRAASG